MLLEKSRIAAKRFFILLADSRKASIRVNSGNLHYILATHTKYGKVGRIRYYGHWHTRPLEYPMVLGLALPPRIIHKGHSPLQINSRTANHRKAIKSIYKEAQVTVTS